MIYIEWELFETNPNKDTIVDEIHYFWTKDAIHVFSNLSRLLCTTFKHVELGERALSRARLTVIGIMK